MMKKFFALLLLGAASVFAATFTVSDYKAGYATVPLFYKGTLTMSSGYTDGDCSVRALKAAYPAYVALCQPCLDCYYDCAEVDGSDYDVRYANPNGLDPQGVTGVLDYIVEIDKRGKAVYYFEIPFDGNAVFFNYDYQMGKKQVSLYQTGAVADEPFFYLVGVKDSKRWTFGKGANKINLLCSTTKTFNGVASYAAWADLGATDGSKFFNGVMKLTRDDSVTKKLMAEMVSGICGNVPCEDFIDGVFAEYVLNKSYKKYEWVCLDSFFEFFED